ncbi:hypothetical protein [Streptomyces sp. NBC_00648]|uniref:hypothetical protein n=1 Tax=Streptomyces sp. NBC_00648 TaxID=2975797 RepID=UPI002F916A79
MTTHPNPPTGPTQPPATPAAPQPGPTTPGPAPAEASLRRLVIGVLAGLVVLAALFAFYVLLEHPKALPALAGVSALFTIGGFALLANRRP